MSDKILTIAYLFAGVLFIRSLGGLSKQETATSGNVFGMAGMTLAGVATTIAWLEKGAGIVTVALLGAAVVGGSIVGAALARRVEMTGMPELVAILHSFVGLAAVLVGVSSYVTPIETHDLVERNVHLLEIWIGVAVGAITFTGSVIAFGKLRGSISGKPLLLPGRH
ncbi:MAG: NAD(P)(+) transhydrogenase (Re/Si-specific) subunit beta, partial [Polyangiales bacterium]